MCSKKSSTPNKAITSRQSSRTGIVSSAISYTLPVFRDAPSYPYIEFYCFDPDKGKMRRKRIKTKKFAKMKNRRQYINGIIARLTDQLMHGWNPWISDNVAELALFNDSLSAYESFVERMLSGGNFRKQTYARYKSNINVLREYATNIKPIHYTYQYNKRFCVDFLDYIFIDRNNCAQTRNNYLVFLKVLSGFFVEKGYLEVRPTDGIAPISKRLIVKERTCIPEEFIEKIEGHCRKKDPHFLLACYLLYYSFVRPVEMTRLHIDCFNIKNGTLTIPADSSKNRKTQTVTLPKKVLLYAIDLGIFTNPSSYFIFSEKLRPGKVQIETKLFRDHWEKLRRSLRMKREWKFYSLKDTGITAMLQANLPAIDVRDQARHSSLAITDIYAAHTTKANAAILDMDGAL